jgi:heme exporter protein C
MKPRHAVVFLAAAAGAGLFLLLPRWVFEHAPLDWQLYISQKIFYYHVPAAFMMFLSVFVCGGASLGFLKTRRVAWDDVASAAADCAVVFGAIVLTTGPIWAKAAWGVYWVWEARLTLSLLLWLIFVAYVLVRRYGGPGAERLGAGLALFGTVNVPLVYMAVNFWRTQHPTTNVVPTLKGAMREVFGYASLAYLAIWAVLFALRFAIGSGERRLSAAHDLAVENGHLD